MRWALAVNKYDLTIIHCAGAQHANADVPSRFPVGTSADRTGAQLDAAEACAGGVLKMATEGERRAYVDGARDPCRPPIVPSAFEREGGPLTCKAQPPPPSP